MIKAIIIEDEINAREALKKMIKIIDPTIEIVGETGFVNKGIQLLKSEKPALVFLDIELEDGSGFDILKEIENIDFKIIFTTAYNQYAVNAFKYSAIDYLLKPIDPLELQEATKKAKTAINDRKEYQELLEILKNNIAKKERKIVLKTAEQRYVLFVKDIIHLEADGAYTNFICKDQKLIISKNLKHYQDLLDDNFIRCHQSHLVNSSHIQGIDKKGHLQLSNLDTVPISSRKKTEIVQFIMDL